MVSEGRVDTCVITNLGELSVSYLLPLWHHKALIYRTACVSTHFLKSTESKKVKEGLFSFLGNSLTVQRDISLLENTGKVIFTCKGKKS